MKKLNKIGIALLLALNLGAGALIAMDTDCGNRWFANGCKVTGKACVLTPPS